MKEMGLVEELGGGGKQVGGGDILVGNIRGGRVSVEQVTVGKEWRGAGGGMKVGEVGSKVVRSGKVERSGRGARFGMSVKVESPGSGVGCSQEGVLSGRYPASLTEMELSGGGAEREATSCSRGRLYRLVSLESRLV